VLILPYVDEKPLYDQFHLDEPWDSEHNKKLIPKMPAVFRSPNYSGPPGKTVYLGIGGEHGLLGDKKGLPMAKIVDGTSNTVMLVEANNELAVEWTRPADYVPDLEQPAKGLGGLHASVFIAAFGDGSIRNLSPALAPKTLKALFTYDGNEAVSGF
jgi:hypothetical protein